MKLSRAIFLDRDGTLIEEKEYLSDPELVSLFPNVGPALRRLSDAGYKLVVVSNQSGVGRGYFTTNDVEAVNQRVLDLLKPEGVAFDGVYYAPEAPEKPSRGRKPSPQFLFDARDSLQLDLSSSYMIGDKMSDLECGWNAGCKNSLLVRTGYGRELEQGGAAKLKNAVVVDDLPAAADWILQ